MFLRFISIALLVALASNAADLKLKVDTRQAWDEYLQAQMADMQSRLQPGRQFLWLDEQPERLEHVRTKGPLIVPIGHPIPKLVAAGLIHAWLGAGFLPDTTIADILKVVRDYDHYADMYHPGVLSSKLEKSDGDKDSFFLRFANRSVVAKTALDSEGESSFVRVDQHRLYSYSNTTHIQEVDKFGTPEQRTLPEDEGTGFIWRLSSIMRLEERDGGVYAELEAYALSRDIPAALRLFVSPIVRRVSRDSLATSLHQTKAALDAQKAAAKTLIQTVTSPITPEPESSPRQP